METLKLVHKSGKMDVYTFSFGTKSFSIRTTQPLTRMKRLNKLIEYLSSSNSAVKISPKDVCDLYKLRVMTDDGRNVRLLLTIKTMVEKLITKLEKDNQK